MIKLENYEVVGWEHAIRGMRNPMNSWETSDTEVCTVLDEDQCKRCAAFRKSDGMFSFCTQPFIVGPNDHELMMKLGKAGPVHGKYRRMIEVYVDIMAPLYWWKEFDTYKVGTVANSCSTMHKIHVKEFTIDDFSHEHLITGHDLIKDEELKANLDVLEKYQLEGQILTKGEHDLLAIESEDLVEYLSPTDILEVYIISALNLYRDLYLKYDEMIKNKHGSVPFDEDVSKRKTYWWQMIQLLPSSYNQKRTVMLNYEVLANMYEYRKDHKLNEWREFCKWIESLPYSEIITGGRNNETKRVEE